MKNNSKFKEVLLRLPGWCASLMMIVLTTFWTYWSFGEMYHEGWWGAWTNRVVYLAPAALTLLPTLLAFRWPVAGGVFIVGVGIFAFFMFAGDVQFIGLLIALLGAVFIIDGLLKRKRRADAAAALPWWRRHWRMLLALLLPLAAAVSVSAYMLPVVLTRQDDGGRGVRTITGNDITLVWAPEGPGWNWKQSWGGYPSWQAVALYGLPPVGLGEKPGITPTWEGETSEFASAEDMQTYNLCRYLSEDGLTLMDQPQDIWRMPTTDELVRSLARHGENAGCTWKGEVARQSQCTIVPDKESPLWASDQPVIYYWSADAYSEREGYFVAYNGMVNATYKAGGNPRHSYRCVREP